MATLSSLGNAGKTVKVSEHEGQVPNEMDES